MKEGARCAMAVVKLLKSSAFWCHGHLRPCGQTPVGHTTFLQGAEYWTVPVSTDQTIYWIYILAFYSLFLMRFFHLSLIFKVILIHLKRWSSHFMWEQAFLFCFWNGSVLYVKICLSESPAVRDFYLVFPIFWSHVQINGFSGECFAAKDRFTCYCLSPCN